MRILNIALAAGACLALALPASAQLINGNFELGGLGWTMTVPPTWTGNFPPAGGNPGGFAHIQSPFGNSGGTGCVQQTFTCGDADPVAACVFTLDYFLNNIDASSLSGRITIYVDGVLLFTSAPANDIPWSTVSFATPCGVHTLQLCLEVDAGNNGWEAGFDNVLAECDNPTPAETLDWSTVKTLY
jgi:hypothetical protein